MALPVRVSVPQRAIAVMTWLAELPEADFGSLLSKITDGEPVSSRTELVDRFRQAVPDAPAARSDELVSELISLISLNISYDWDINQIADSASTSRSLSLNSEQRQVLSRRLSQAISDPTLLKLAKAIILSGEYQNLLHTSSVSTDMRPVFESTRPNRIIGAVITHTIKLEYHALRGREELYISLDNDDLEQLRDAVTRAIRERQALEEFIKSADLPDLSDSST